MSLVDDAIAFAARAHAGQRRKYTAAPYIVHPVEVMTIVNGWVRDEDMLAAAVLHDVLEDCPGYDVGLLELRFGLSTAALVEELTEVKTEGNRATRKAAERDRLAKVSEAAQTIKLADLISNTRDIAQHDPKFAKVYLEEKRELLEVLTRPLLVPQMAAASALMAAELKLGLCA